MIQNNSLQKPNTQDSQLITHYDFIVIGGGAAGFFAAINAAEKNPSLKIAIIERGKDVLQKVRISGGGRCNLTHACFEPAELIKSYPRGQESLLQPFNRFGPTDTITWFEKHGVKTKTEADGRMFPTSDSSQTIIDCFLKSCYDLNIKILKSTRIDSIALIKNNNSPQENEENNSPSPREKGLGDEAFWQIQNADNQHFTTKKLMLATGSDTAIWKLLEGIDLAIVPPVPSLFTFNIADKRMNEMMGVSFKNLQVAPQGMAFKTNGGGVITHWGLSGPAILKMSALAARDFHAKNYRFDLKINWLGETTKEAIQQQLLAQTTLNPKKSVMANAEFGLSNRFWKYICENAEIKEFQKWAETGKKHIQRLTDALTASPYKVEGKSTFKEEFVTAGGVDLSEIDFETFSLKKYPTLFMAGEVLNIDAITGGFNFQAAWTGGWHVGEAVGKV
jgi:predicted flavoprotein YhiN